MHLLFIGSFPLGLHGVVNYSFSSLSLSLDSNVYQDCLRYQGRRAKIYFRLNIYLKSSPEEASMWIL